jgi:hypothetical protein
MEVSLNSFLDRHSQLGQDGQTTKISKLLDCAEFISKENKSRSRCLHTPAFSNRRQIPNPELLKQFLVRAAASPALQSQSLASQAPTSRNRVY